MRKAHRLPLLAAVLAAACGDATITSPTADGSGPEHAAAVVATDAPGRFAAQVSAGERHTCAVLTSGTIECWGDDTYGQSSPPTGSYT
ncbi:MAG: RCC1 domain-containing protein [Gemmatimonadota bacterium]